MVKWKVQIQCSQTLIWKYRKENRNRKITWLLHTHIFWSSAVRFSVAFFSRKITYIWSKFHENMNEYHSFLELGLLYESCFPTRFPSEVSKLTSVRKNIEILIHGNKSCLLDVLSSPEIIKISSRYNTDYIWWEQ